MRKRVISVLLALTYAVMALVLPAAAVEELPSGSSYRLALRLAAETIWTQEEVPLPDVQYRLYQVGELSGFADGKYTYTPIGAFADVGVELDRLNFLYNADDTAAKESLIEKAEALAAYVEENELQADGSMTTNVKGTVTFTNLGAGLYLALGEPIDDTLGGLNYTFTPQATLAAVPFQNGNGRWSSYVGAEVKLEATVKVSVKVIWDGENPPASVTVTLRKDTADYDSQTLNAAGAWSYVWDVPADQSGWWVQAPVVKGWKEPVIVPSGNDFTITYTPADPPEEESPPVNSDDPETTPPASSSPTSRPRPATGDSTETSTPATDVTSTPVTTDDPTLPPSGEPDASPTATPPATPTATPSATPSEPPTPGDDPAPSSEPTDPGDAFIATTPDDPEDPGLPQTGQLWWPVLLLAAVGALMLLVGVVLFVRREKPHK